MKKFSETVIFSVPNDLIQGGSWPDHIQQLMRNQNEFIDFLEKTHPKQFEAWHTPKENPFGADFGDDYT